MAQAAASLQTYNLQLVKSLEQLQAGRGELRQQVLADQAERARLESDVAALSKRLRQLGEGLSQKQGALEAFDRVIQQTEAAMGKLVENSHALLAMTQRSSEDIHGLLRQSTAPRAERA